MNRETKLILGLIDPDAPRPDKAVAAEVAARVMDGAMATNTARETTAEVAARLDGGLDGEAQDRLDRTLAADGQEYQEMAASAELVDAVAARLVAVPADLLGQVTATPNAKPDRPTRRWTPWLWVGGAVLAAALAAVLVLRHHPMPPDGKGEIMAKPTQGAMPQMVPAGSLESTPSPSQGEMRGGK
ncbi:hypothetical protein [Magnetospirillum sp. 15-1]|uniref:hypothetical protein n=1 Tax=Magnetospirillum sp. 15-1 TaxID=1979370 RepID=UPI0011433765|nr:hypothetical protein [Magnetospirillum sp. 15-1]